MWWGWAGSENCDKWTFVVVLMRMSPRHRHLDTWYPMVVPFGEV